MSLLNLLWVVPISFFAGMYLYYEVLHKQVKNRTGNEIMFQCEADILNHDPKHASEVQAFIDDWHKNKGKEVNYNFSFDNWFLVYCWVKKFKPEILKTLPLFGYFSVRPDNFLTTLYMKYPLIGFIFLPVIFSARVISMVRVWRETAHGSRYIDTDGKIIAFFLVEVFEMKLTKRALDYIIKKHPDLKSWENIFSIYFKPDHYVMEAFMSRKETIILNTEV